MVKHNIKTGKAVKKMGKGWLFVIGLIVGTALLGFVCRSEGADYEGPYYTVTDSDTVWMGEVGFVTTDSSYFGEECYYRWLEVFAQIPGILDPTVHLHVKCYVDGFLEVEWVRYYRDSFTDLNRYYDRAVEWLSMERDGIGEVWVVYEGEVGIKVYEYRP